MVYHCHNNLKTKVGVQFMKLKLHLYIIIIFLTSNTHASKIDDLDITCRIFTEAKNTTFTKEQRSTYVKDNINSRVHSKGVRDAYFVIFNLQPKERYSIFKKAVEKELKKNWECRAAQELLR